MASRKKKEARARFKVRKKSTPPPAAAAPSPEPTLSLQPSATTSPPPPPPPLSTPRPCAPPPLPSIVPTKETDPPPLYASYAPTCTTNTTPVSSPPPSTSLPDPLAGLRFGSFPAARALTDAIPISKLRGTGSSSSSASLRETHQEPRSCGADHDSGNISLPPPSMRAEPIPPTGRQRAPGKSSALEDDLYRLLSFPFEGARINLTRSRETNDPNLLPVFLFATVRQWVGDLPGIVQSLHELAEKRGEDAEINAAAKAAEEMETIHGALGLTVHLLSNKMERDMHGCSTGSCEGEGESSSGAVGR